jgi:hypothetical protein
VAGVPFLALRMCSGFEVDLLPAEVHHFGCSEAMPVGHKHHERVAMAVAVLPDRLNQLLDFVGGEVLTGAQLRVACAPRHDCSIFSGWRNQPQVRFCHGQFALLDSDCSNNRHFLNDRRTKGRPKPPQGRSVKAGARVGPHECHALSVIAGAAIDRGICGRHQAFHGDHIVSQRDNEVTLVRHLAKSARSSQSLSAARNAQAWILGSMSRR